MDGGAKDCGMPFFECRRRCDRRIAGWVVVDARVFFSSLGSFVDLLQNCCRVALSRRYQGTAQVSLVHRLANHSLPPKQNREMQFDALTTTKQRRKKMQWQ